MPIVVALLAVVAWGHEVRVEMLDVGQGDSILLTFSGADPTKYILIDAGDLSADVAGQLASRGVGHLDLVVSTHAHADHIGGTRAVLQVVPTRMYLDNGIPYTTQVWRELSATLATMGIRALRPATPFRHVRLAPDVTLTLLSPLPGEHIGGNPSDQNANSLVLRLDHGNDCFLFMGDAEAPTERLLVERGLQPCDVLKVGHHGSDGATSEVFLAAVRPELALVSVGAHNQYGHPGAATLDRLERDGAKVLRTDQDGAITVWSSGSGLRFAVASSQPVASSPALGVHVPDPTPDPAACPYPASRNSPVFHEPSCSMVDRISPSKLLCYPTAEDALNAGRRSGLCCTRED